MDALLTYLFTDEFQKLLIATGLGALIGLEREIAGKDPSLRTFAIIAVGSCAFSMLSVTAASMAAINPANGIAMADPGRIGAQIVTGIGFLGAGAIIQTKRNVSGITTAALIWLTAAIGMAVGYNRTSLAVSATVLGLIVTVVIRLFHRLIDHLKPGYYKGTTDFDE